MAGLDADAAATRRLPGVLTCSERLKARRQFDIGGTTPGWFSENDAAFFALRTRTGDCAALQARQLPPFSGRGRKAF